MQKKNRQLKNTFVISFYRTFQSGSAVSIEIPDFWEPIDSPIFDVRIRLMMTEYKANAAMLTHFDSHGSITVIGEWF